MITYRSADLFNERFHRTMKNKWGESHEEVTFDIESYLVYQGYKLTERFDANSYLYLLKAMDSYDIGNGRGGLEKALSQIQAPVFAFGFKGDLLYPPEEIWKVRELLRGLGKPAWYYFVDTIYGHDGFLADFNKWPEFIKGQLVENKYLNSIAY